MTTRELIDAVESDVLDLDLGDTYAETDWRPIILRALKLISSEVVAYSNNYLRQASGTVTVTAGVGAVPADWGGQLGPDGGVWAPEGKKLKYRPPAWVFDAVEGSPDLADIPEYYTTYGGQFHTYPKFTGTLVVKYHKKNPVLIDKNTAGHGLDYFHEDYHESVLLLGTGARVLAGIEGARQRAKDDEARYHQNRELMRVALMQGKEDEPGMGDEGYSDLLMW